MSKISGIYAIRHTASGRCYVGQSYWVSHRWGEHRRGLRKGSHHSVFLQRSWNKYGESAHEFVLLEECPVQALTDREQHWMDQLRPAFNVEPAAGSSLGVKRRPETLAKLSASRARTHTDPEFRRRMSETKKRVLKEQPEIRERISVATKAAMSDPAVRKRTLAGLKKVHADPAYRAKQSAAKKGKLHTEEHKRKISDGVRAKGYRHDDHMIEHLSQSAREREARNATPVEFRGEVTTLRALTDHFGVVPYMVAWKRMRRGWSAERAVLEPYRAHSRRQKELFAMRPTNNNSSAILRIS